MNILLGYETKELNEILNCNIDVLSMNVLDTNKENDKKLKKYLKSIFMNGLETRGYKRVKNILTNILNCNNDRVIINDIELYLHPQELVNFMRVLIEIDRKINITIRTNNELPLLVVEQSVRKGLTKANDHEITYFDVREEITLNLDSEGDITNIKDVPGGLFEEGFNLVFNIK